MINLYYKKIKAISEVSGEDFELIAKDFDGDTCETLGYIALTRTEANEMAKETILDMAWTFDSTYLEDLTGVDADTFLFLQQKGEIANKCILSIINATAGINEFVEDVIECDGRTPYISNYDDGEYRVVMGGDVIYVYTI